MLLAEHAHLLLRKSKIPIINSIIYEIVFINSQFASLDKAEHFTTEIAPARTFVFVRDIEPLLKANLIKGGDLDNAIVIYEKQISQEQLDKLADMIQAPHHDANWLLMNFELKEHMAVRLNSSSGSIVMHDPVVSSLTSIFFQ